MRRVTVELEMLLMDVLKDLWWFVLAIAAAAGWLLGWAIKLSSLQAKQEAIAKSMGELQQCQENTDRDLSETLGLVCNALFAILDHEVAQGANGSIKLSRNELQKHLTERI